MPETRRPDLPRPEPRRTLHDLLQVCGDGLAPPLGESLERMIDLLERPAGADRR